MKKLKFVIVGGVIYPRGEKPLDCPMPKIMAMTYEISRTFEQIKKEGYPLCWEECLHASCSLRDAIKNHRLGKINAG